MINRFNHLRNERLLCSLPEVKGEFELAPNIFGSFDLWSHAVSRRNKWAGVNRANPRDGVLKSCIPFVGQNEAKVAVEAASKCGGNGCGISHDLGRESL